MIEWFESIDRAIVLAVNSANSPFLDKVMWIISGRIMWIPFYVFLIVKAIQAMGARKGFLLVGLTILSIICADLISVHVFKNVFERYRPSHHALLTHRLHFYQFENGEFYKGGQFGFVSSHATNFFALGTMFYLALRNHYKWIGSSLAFVLILVCYSRIYLGVHYFTDVLGGAILGAAVSYFFWLFLWKKRGGAQKEIETKH